MILWLTKEKNILTTMIQEIDGVKLASVIGGQDSGYGTPMRGVSPATGPNTSEANLSASQASSQATPLPGTIAALLGAGALGSVPSVVSQAVRIITSYGDLSTSQAGSPRP
jgi:hypothetical protein